MAQPVVGVKRTREGNTVKLFIGKIGDSATEEDVKALFEQFGPVMEVALIRNQMKKYGFVHV
jgi:RNA recognition motif-containing protein